jgi:hypothetical protein
MTAVQCPSLYHGDGYFEAKSLPNSFFFGREGVHGETKQFSFFWLHIHLICSLTHTFGVQQKPPSSKPKGQNDYVTTEVSNTESH